jgi:hypothetical protein
MERKIKTIVIGISFLLTVLPGMISCFEQDEGNTIYVDDDNTEGPWDRSIVYPYQNVEDAVDVATNGITIFVFNGT